MPGRVAHLVRLVTAVAVQPGHLAAQVIVVLVVGKHELGAGLGEAGAGRRGAGTFSRLEGPGRRRSVEGRRHFASLRGVVGVGIRVE